MLYQRLNELNIIDSKWINEQEIVEGIYEELGKYLTHFQALLSILKGKLIDIAYRLADNHCSIKIEKIMNDNNILLSKINNLSKINSEIEEENKKLKESIKNYQILLAENPDFIVNYKNIVNKMLGQCKIISTLKKENKALKKIESICNESNLSNEISKHNALL